MNYYVPLRRKQHGYNVPDVPEGISYSLLISPPDYGNEYQMVGWAIYTLRGPSHVLQGLEKVDREFAELIDSGTHYPPALALTISELKAVTDEPVTRKEFRDLVCDRLKFHLSRSPVDGFGLARCIEKDPVDLELAEGGYYWIIGWGEMAKQSVLWVGRDWILWKAPIEFFDLKIPDIPCLAVDFSKSDLLAGASLQPSGLTD